MPPSNLSLELSPEQQEILDEKHRLKIVSACPGAGKTRLFVAALKHYKSLEKRAGSGIAALSFTNVAQDEISQRLGGWYAPDFVGTIDSFLLRFVLRPFGHLVGVKKGGLQLIPAALYSHFNESIRVGATDKVRANIHDVTFVGKESNGTPILKARASYKTEMVHPSAYDSVLKAKRKMWQNFGYVSHSDSHYLCESLLGGGSGVAVVKIVTQRFPFILVDELQDTQFFLGESLRRLFASPLVQGLAVGDPDQAIYEFGGAHPTLFADLQSVSGAKPFALEVSRRCSTAVCLSSTHLSCTGQAIKPKDGAAPGRSVLVRLGDDDTEVPQTIAKFVSSVAQAEERIAILARKNETLSRLNGRGDAAEFPGSSKLTHRVHEAVLKMILGDAASGRRMIESDLAELVFEKRGGIRDSLFASGMPFLTWNRATCSILFEAARCVDKESWGEWQNRVKTAFGTALATLGHETKAKALSQKMRADPNLGGPRVLMLSDASPANWPGSATFRNVHEMKGLEAEVVCFYVPKEPKKGTSISEEWWAAKSEERKVAFVACTRAIRLLALIVHQSTFERLSAARADFVATFEVIDAPFVVPPPAAEVDFSDPVLLSI